MPTFTLDQLPFGHEATILQLMPASRAFRHRLLAMGITPGCPITLVRSAPMGDPLEISARGFRLSLRRKEASAIIVTEIAR